jgi:hypothetical protein
MQLRQSLRAIGAPAAVRLLPLLCALFMAGCNTVAQQNAATAFATPRGATVAFESIDGPPRDVFDRLVQDLNSEARGRQLAVVSREDAAAYRVRGYLGAQSASGQKSISWVWDVYDGDHQRVLRLNGEQVIKGKHRDAWQAVDEPAVQKIARDSIDELAAFLTSPSAATQTDRIQAPYAQAAADDSTPEAAGIFRIFQTEAGSAPAAETTNIDAGQGEPEVPLPPQRPRLARTVALVAAPHREN